MTRRMAPNTVCHALKYIILLSHKAHIAQIDIFSRDYGFDIRPRFGGPAELPVARVSTFLEGSTDL